MKAEPDNPYLSGSVTEGPVALVLTNAGGRKDAATVSFFSEVAHHPTTLWISLAARSPMHATVDSSGRFSLAVLHKGQRDIALLCGGSSGSGLDKCSRLDLYETPDGYLFLHGAMASVACRVRSRHPVGDHTVFIADMLSGDVDTRSRSLPHLLLSDLQEGASR